jgi:hypothetical protein
LIRPTVASAGDAQLPIAETKQKCEEDSVVVIADQFPSSKGANPSLKAQGSVPIIRYAALNHQVQI